MKVVVQGAHSYLGYKELHVAGQGCGVVERGRGEHAAHKHGGAQLDALDVHEAAVDIHQQQLAKVQYHDTPPTARIQKRKLQTSGCGFKRLQQNDNHIRRRKYVQNYTTIYSYYLSL
jgi:hypothetical protein